MLIIRTIPWAFLVVCERLCVRFELVILQSRSELLYAGWSQMLPFSSCAKARKSTPAMHDPIQFCNFRRRCTAAVCQLVLVNKSADAVFLVHDAKTSDDPSQWPFMIYISYPNPLPAVNSRASSELSLPGTPPASMSLPSTADSPANHSNRIPTLADMKHRASAFAEPFSSAIASISDGTKVWGGVLYDWPTPLEGWDNRRGTVTLAGDAAHPMTPRTFS